MAATETPALIRDNEISASDQVQILSPYFPHFQQEKKVARYFQPTSLGDPYKYLVQWQGLPAAHWAVFPFPYLLDGQERIGGKPEASALHADVIFRVGRPDLFGITQDALISTAREQRWPILVGKTTPTQRKSMKKRGFVDVDMPVVRAYWPLAAHGTGEWTGTFLERRFSMLESAPGFLKKPLYYALGLGLSIATQFRTPSPAGAKLSSESTADLAANAKYFETNYWPDRRITVSRNCAYFRDRFEATSGHEILTVNNDSESGVAILRHAGNELWVQDVLPPQLMLQPAFWGGLVQYARKFGAGILAASFYLNDPHQVNALEMLRKMGGAIFRPASMIYSVLVLDSEFSYATDPHAWAGTSLLMAGF